MLGTLKLQERSPHCTFFQGNLDLLFHQRSQCAYLCVGRQYQARLKEGSFVKLHSQGGQLPLARCKFLGKTQADTTCHQQKHQPRASLLGDMASPRYTQLACRFFPQEFSKNPRHCVRLSP